MQYVYGIYGTMKHNRWLNDNCVQKTNLILPWRSARHKPRKNDDVGADYDLLLVQRRLDWASSGASATWRTCEETRYVIRGRCLARCSSCHRACPFIPFGQRCVVWRSWTVWCNAAMNYWQRAASWCCYVHHVIIVHVVISLMTVENRCLCLLRFPRLWRSPRPSACVILWGVRWALLT